MNTRSALFMLVTSLMVSAGGCGGPAEFIAQASNFQGFSGWTQTSPTLMGPGPMVSAVGPAHGAMDATARRSMYINAMGQSGRAGTAAFALGTVLVKEQRAADGTVQMTLGMAKRGNGFNPTAGNWEWFILDASGAITTRGGAEVMMGACNGCHAAASARDHVFTR